MTFLEFLVHEVGTAEFARRVGISPTMVYYITRGERTLTPRMRGRIAAAFDVPARTLLKQVERNTLVRLFQSRARERRSKRARVIRGNGPLVPT